VLLFKKLISLKLGNQTLQKIESMHFEAKQAQLDIHTLNEEKWLFYYLWYHVEANGFVLGCRILCSGISCSKLMNVVVDPFVDSLFVVVVGSPYQDGGC